MHPDVLYRRAIDALPPESRPIRHVARCQRIWVALQCLQRGSLLWRPGRYPPCVGEA